MLYSIPVRVLVFALVALLLLAALVGLRYGIDPAHLHHLASIIGDPHHCSGGSPGPGCGNGN
jgi:hypothetical protein